MSKQSKRVNWTDEQLLSLWGLRMAGISVRQLGAAVGVSGQRVNVVVREFAERQGLPVPGRAFAPQMGRDRRGDVQGDVVGAGAGGAESGDAAERQGELLAA